MTTHSPKISKLYTTQHNDKCIVSGKEVCERERTRRHTKREAIQSTKFIQMNSAGAIIRAVHYSYFLERLFFIGGFTINVLYTYVLTAIFLQNGY